MTYGVEIYNDKGEKIIGSDAALAGIVLTTVLGDLPQYHRTFTKPAFIDRDVSETSNVKQDVAPESLSFLKWADGACICGRTMYSAYAGTLYHCNQSFKPESGYQDIYDANGNLMWSAKSAGKIPMISDMLEISGDDLVNGVTVSVKGNAILMNNLPSFMRHPPRENYVIIGGLHMKFTGQTVRMQFYVSLDNGYTDGFKKNLNGMKFKIFFAYIY